MLRDLLRNNLLVASRLLLVPTLVVLAFLLVLLVLRAHQPCQPKRLTHLWVPDHTVTQKGARLVEAALIEQDCGGRKLVGIVAENGQTSSPELIALCLWYGQFSKKSCSDPQPPDQFLTPWYGGNTPLFYQRGKTLHGRVLAGPTHPGGPLLEQYDLQVALK